MKVALVVGARPNFMKIAPLFYEIRRWNEKMRLARTGKRRERIDAVLVHTGQHYDYEMDKIFFKDLELPAPDFYLGVGSGSHAEQTAKVMLGFERILVRERPDVVVVVGDVNSTLACALATAKFRCALSTRHHSPTTNYPFPIIAHIEAGLRSFDSTMPEEVNRIVTDHLSDLLFTTCADANRNLKREGISGQRIFFVGNLMIDTLLKNKAKAETSDILKRLGLEGRARREKGGGRTADRRVKVKGGRGIEIQIANCKMQNAKLITRQYAVLTLHRPENVDDPRQLREIVTAIIKLSVRLTVVFPVHPRIKKMISQIQFRNSNVIVTEPLGYLDFIKLLSHATVVLTDSGGIQEEATVLGIPCLTLRDSTERPVTVRQGTNALVGTDPVRLVQESLKIIGGEVKCGRIPEQWDGKSAERIIRVIVRDGGRKTGEVRRGVKGENKQCRM